MKTTLTVLTLSLFIGASVASASDESTKDKAPKKEKVASSKVEKQKVAAKDEGKEELSTGSHMKQRVRRNGMITDGSSQVLVVDRAMIDRSGASTVSQVLNRYGAR